jgi:hypothetical protein
MLALVLLAAGSPVQAQEQNEIPAGAPDICKEVLENTANDFTGWRRNFYNGYADSFEFHGYPDETSALVRSFSIDDTAYEVDTSCFDETGKLSFVGTYMHSANMVGDTTQVLERYGEIEVDAKGKPTKAHGWIVTVPLDETIKPEKFPLTDAPHQLTRDCLSVELYASTAEVQTAMDAVLGDIDGKRPAFKATEYDWCAKATTP